MRRLLATTILVALVSSALAQLSNQKQTADSKLLNGMPATLGYAMARGLPELCGTPDHSDDFAAVENEKDVPITVAMSDNELMLSINSHRPSLGQCSDIGLAKCREKGRKSAHRPI